MNYGDFKDLAKRIASDKVLHNKPFNVAKNLRYHEYQRGLALLVCKCFNKKFAATQLGTGINSNSDSENQQLADELHEPIFRKLKRLKA